MGLTSPLAIAVAAVGLLLAVLGTWGAAREVPDFWDPCMEWGIGEGAANGTSSMTVFPGDDCPMRGGTSETRPQAALRLAVVDGSAIAAGALAVVGAWRRSALPLAVAAALMAVEAAVLFLGLSIAFPVALAAAVLFAVAARRWRRREPA